MVMRLLDLFSGIGGFSYAAEKLVGGYETVAFCEQDKFCQQVLRKHWPHVPIYDDVRTIDATRLGNIDIVAGGFPCQAVSQAGLQKATEDDRWLWDEMLRIIQDCKPRWVIGENVVGLININQGILFEQVQTDLEKEGYSVQSVVIPACAKNAPHRRDRVWIVGNSEHNGSLATKIRGGNEQIDGGSSQGQNQTSKLEGTSGREDDGFIQTDIFELMANANSSDGGNRTNDEDIGNKGWKSSKTGGESIQSQNGQTRSSNSKSSSQPLADSNNAGDRTPRSSVNTEQQEVEQRREEQSQSELSRQREDVSNTKSNGNRRVSRDLDKKREKKERQGFGYVFQESVNDGEDDVSNTKRMGWTDRAEIRETSEREGWADKSSNSSSTVTETKDAANSNDKRLQGFRQHKQLEGEQREDEFAKSSTPTTKHRATQCRMGYMADGISEALSGHFSEEPADIPRVTQNQKDRTKKLKALGNSIVPQVAAELFYAIKVTHDES